MDGRWSFAYLSHVHDRTSVDGILRLFCSRYVGMYPQRCRAGACSCRKQTSRTPLYGYVCPPTAVGEDIILPQTNVSHHPHGYRPCKHTSLPFVHYSAFFLKKDGTKKDFRASYAGPEAYPASDVHPSARQSATFCRFVYVTKWGFAAFVRFSPAPTRSDIGVCNSSFIL